MIFASSLWTFAERFLNFPNKNLVMGLSLGGLMFEGYPGQNFYVNVHFCWLMVGYVGFWWGGHHETMDISQCWLQGKNPTHCPVDLVSTGCRSVRLMKRSWPSAPGEEKWMLLLVVVLIIIIIIIIIGASPANSFCFGPCPIVADVPQVPRCECLWGWARTCGEMVQQWWNRNPWIFNLLECFRLTQQRAFRLKMSWATLRIADFPNLLENIFQNFSDFLLQDGQELFSQLPLWLLPQATHFLGQKGQVEGYVKSIGSCYSHQNWVSKMQFPILDW